MTRLIRRGRGEVDLLRLRTREGMEVARAKGKLKGKQPKLTARQQSHLVQQHQSGEHTIADLADFWACLGWTVSAHRATFLEETFASNASRWHRLSRDNITTVRSQLAPRAQLAVWPDLLTDVDTAMAALPDEGLVEIIWETEDGQITSTVADETRFEDVTSQLAGARAAGVVSMYAGEDLPLFELSAKVTWPRSMRRGPSAAWRASVRTWMVSPSRSPRT